MANPETKPLTDGEATPTRRQDDRGGEGGPRLSAAHLPEVEELQHGLPFGGRVPAAWFLVAAIAVSLLVLALAVAPLGR
jgi:hypothetical protein